jgi:hypothetical protein
MSDQTKPQPRPIKPELTDQAKASRVIQRVTSLSRIAADGMARAFTPEELQAVVAVFEDLGKPDQAPRVWAVLDQFSDRKAAEAKAKPPTGEIAAELPPPIEGSDLTGS